MKQYITPEVTVIEMEIEQSLLGTSTETSTSVNLCDTTDEEHVP